MRLITAQNRRANIATHDERLDTQNAGASQYQGAHVPLICYRGISPHHLPGTFTRDTGRGTTRRRDRVQTPSAPSPASLQHQGRVRVATFDPALMQERARPPRSEILSSFAFRP